MPMSSKKAAPPAAPKKKSAAKKGASKSAPATTPRVRRSASDFPIHICGDYVVDELVPDDATVNLSTKDPALWTLGSVQDGYVKFTAGGAWIQHRMMVSIANAWDQWREDVRQHLLTQYKENLKKDPKPPLPVILQDSDFPEIEAALHPGLTGDEKKRIAEEKREQGHIVVGKPVPDDLEQVPHAHTYQWTLKRRPQESPVDDKNKVYRGTAITPRRHKSLKKPTDLGLDAPPSETCPDAVLHIIGDYNLDFRYQDIWQPTNPAGEEWRKCLQAQSKTGLPCRIILLGSTLPGDSQRDFERKGAKVSGERADHFWKAYNPGIPDMYKDTVLIAGMDMLRLAGADVAYDQSWDRILEDFSRELQENEKLRELCRFEHLVVRIGVTGAIYHYNPTPGKLEDGNSAHKTLLIYNPDAPRIWYRAPDAQGNILGLRSAFATCIAARFAQGWTDAKNWKENKPAAAARKELSGGPFLNGVEARQLLMRGIKDAICFTQELYLEGYGKDAAKVDEAVGGEHFEKIYRKTVLCGGHDKLGDLKKKADQSWKNVTVRHLPQRSRCIAHVHAPVDDSIMEWGIMRNMLRMGIPEHLEPERAAQLLEEFDVRRWGTALFRTSDMWDDDHALPARETLENQINRYSDMRRLGIAMRIVMKGEKKVFNKNGQHYEYQRLLECLPENLRLEYDGSEEGQNKWQTLIHTANTAWLEDTMQKLTGRRWAAMTAGLRLRPAAAGGYFLKHQALSVLRDWKKLVPLPVSSKSTTASSPELFSIPVAGHKLVQTKISRIADSDLYFFPLKDKGVDEWDLPYYLALEIWAQRSKWRRLRACGGLKKATKNAEDRATVLENYLRLLMWTYPCQAPVAEYGNMKAIDQRNVEAMANIRNLIISHVRSGSGKPLNIGIFGGPGSGKSFGVKEIAKELGKEMIEELNFNMAHFQGKEDLDAAFLRVSSEVARGKTPLVFFDEFDCPGPEPGEDFQWLSHFLEPMQDGTYQHDGGALNLRNSIFIFAGGRHDSYQEFQARVLRAKATGDVTETKRRKFPDFLSRLRGYVNISGLNSQDMEDTWSTEERVVPYMQRALMLRNLLERNNGCERDKDDKPADALIDPDVAEAFLTTSRYHHGKRSVENLLSMCVRLSHKTVKASFPTTHQLDMHTWGAEFRERMQLPGCAWLTPFLFIPPRDVSESLDGVYPSWAPVKDWELLRLCDGLNISEADVQRLIFDFVIKILEDKNRIRLRDGNMRNAEEKHVKDLMDFFGIREGSNMSKTISPVSGPWKRPWEAYMTEKQAEALGSEVWEAKFASLIGNTRDWCPLGSALSSVAKLTELKQLAMPLVMLEQVHPVCMRLVIDERKGLCLLSDSTRLAANLRHSDKLGYHSEGIWEAAWAWEKKDKSRILRHLVKNFYVAVHGPKKWKDYESLKREEWAAIQRDRRQQEVWQAVQTDRHERWMP